MKVGLITLAILAVGAVLATGSASGSGSRAEQTIPVLRVGILGALPTMDIARSQSSGSITSLALEKLLDIAPDFKTLRPQLAARWKQTSSSTYDYELRRGVRFWNGNELTAADVANAMNYARFPGSQVALAFPTVKSIRAIGRYKVRITLKHRDASFKWNVGRFQAQVFEQKFGDEHKGTLGRPGVLTMGTGPWKIDSLDPTRGVELSANDRYRGGRPHIRRISVKFFSDATSMALAFRAGEIDVAPNIENPRAFEATAGANVVSGPSCRVATVSMNTRVAPWNDVHVRRAVAHALNRADLIRASGGNATPVDTLIPPVHLEAIAPKAQVARVLKSLPKYPYNPARARQELAQSAHAPGFKTTLVTHPALSSIGQAIVAQLRAVGIDAELSVVPVGTWVGQIGSPDRRPFTFLASGCSTPDPSFYTYLLGSNNLKQGGFNIANYAPPAVDQHIRSGVQTTNPVKRLDAYAKLLRRLAVDVPYVALWNQQSNLAISPRFTWPTFNDVYYQRTWALEIKSR
jgi:peptide/nickel transport system substrate-binding protein